MGRSSGFAPSRSAATISSTFSFNLRRLVDVRRRAVPCCPSMRRSHSIPSRVRSITRKGRCPRRSVLRNPTPETSGNNIGMLPSPRGDGAQDARLAVTVVAVEHGQGGVERQAELLDGPVVLDLHPFELHRSSFLRIRGSVGRRWSVVGTRMDAPGASSCRASTPPPRVDHLRIRVTGEHFLRSGVDGNPGTGPAKVRHSRFLGKDGASSSLS